MNGDGRDDLAVGVANNGDNGDQSGKIYIFYGRESREAWGPREEEYLPIYVSLEDADLTILGEQAGDQAGSALGATDLNGDGWQDLVVSAPNWDSSGTNRGRVYVIFGYPAGQNPAL